MCVLDVKKLGTTNGHQSGTVYGTDGVAPTVISGVHGNPGGGIVEIKQLGNCMKTPKRDNPNQGRVYDKDGLSPTLSKMDGGADNQ